ncbi:hypothetical protein ACFTQL_23835 [Peribacillus butanolivorans]|uniref:hypothetical protein n=1 Tax=Peribacillus butanolivorans TaxID=421767 RepID=UPI00362BCB6D
MNELLEWKVFNNYIKTLILNLAGLLITDHLADKEYAIKRLLQIVIYNDENDITVKEIEEDF